MKLHLPKLLLTAVIAACAVGTTVQAGTGWGADRSGAIGTLYVNGTGNSQGALDQSGMTITTGTPEGGVFTTYIDATTSGTRKEFIVAADGADDKGVNAEIGTLTIGNGSTMKVAGSGWGTGRHFDVLTIDTLSVVDGGSATYSQTADNTVDIHAVSGALNVTNAGTLTLGGETTTTTFSGTITNSGTMTVNGAVAVTNLNNFTVAVAGTEVWSDTANSQGFKVSQGATYVLSTGNVNYASGLTSVNDNGTLREVTIADDGKATFQGGAVAGTTYYVNTTDVTIGGDSATENTSTATGIVVASGRTVTIAGGTDAAAASDLFKGVTGEGNVDLETSLSISGSNATLATGTLSIASGATLSIGTGDTNTASIASFSTVELDGGAIRFQNKQDTFHNLTVTAEGGALHFADMGQAADSALTTLADTTTLNGDLKFTNEWNVQIQIEKLSGTGNFIIDGNGRNTSNSGTISINGVDNYTGKVKITNLATSMKLSVVENLGLNVYVDSFVENANTKNGLDLTGIGAGNTVTLQGVRGYLPSNGTIAADVVISNSADGSKAGLEINDGSSNSTSTFAGDVSGSGNLVINHALGNYTTKFTGDVSGWTGRLDVANGENYIVFTGDATKINNSEILMRSANKTANITFSHDKAVKVSSDIIRNSGSINLTLNNSSQEGITFTGDSIALTNLTLQSGTKAAFTGVDALTVTDLTLAAGTKVSVGTGVAVAAEGAAPALEVTGAATLAGGSEVEGGLDLSSATSVTLNGMDSAVTITGDLTLPGTAVSLSGDVLTALTGLTAGGKLDLFNVTGVFTLGDAAIASLTAENNTLLNAVFSATEITEDYYLGYENGVVYAGKFDAVVPPTPVDPTVPEPTTATLSLLALAALAARRRRR